MLAELCRNWKVFQEIEFLRVNVIVYKLYGYYESAVLILKRLS